MQFWEFIGGIASEKSASEFVKNNAVNEHIRRGSAQTAYDAYDLVLRTPVDYGVIKPIRGIARFTRRTAANAFNVFVPGTINVGWKLPGRIATGISRTIANILTVPGTTLHWGTSRAESIFGVDTDNLRIKTEET